MSDLEKKLLAAIYAGVSLNKLDAVPKDSTNWFKATRNGDVYEFVIDAEQIKQALTDSGYVNLSDRGGLIHTTVVDSRGKTEYMTGQEWYDRYQNDLKGAVFNHHCANDASNVANTIERCGEAAKKAAGLE